MHIIRKTIKLIAIAFVMLKLISNANSEGLIPSPDRYPELHYNATKSEIELILGKNYKEEYIDARNSVLVYPNKLVVWLSLSPGISEKRAYAIKVKGNNVPFSNDVECPRGISIFVNKDFQSKVNRCHPESKKPKISLANAYKIQSFNTRQEVIQLVGEPTSSIVSKDSINDIYRLDTSNGVDIVTIKYSGGVNVVEEINQKSGDVTTYRDRKVNFSYKEDPPDNFKTINIGMSRAEVIKILGEPKSTEEENEIRFKDNYSISNGNDFSLSYFKLNQKLISAGKYKLPRKERGDFFEMP